MDSFTASRLRTARPKMHVFDFFLLFFLNAPLKKKFFYRA